MKTKYDAKGFGKRVHIKRIDRRSCRRKGRLGRVPRALAKGIEDHDDDQSDGIRRMPRALANDARSTRSAERSLGATTH